MALQLQAPSTRSHLAPPSPLAAPKGNAGLRLPWDRFALKSSFFSSSHSLLLLSPKQQRKSLASSAAPKFSMRVASKQAYICRDCGYIYNDRTPFEKLPDKYFCPGNLLRLTYGIYFTIKFTAFKPLYVQICLV
ncbi:unnamed protein product [Prunus armeniaca]